MEIVIPPFAQSLFDNESGHPIIKYPHPTLRQVATPIPRVTPEIQKLADQMVRAMQDANGVGLAGPQVNVGKRIIVVDPPEGGIKVLINPEIIEMSEETELGLEGCLSIPSLYGDVPRSIRVKVKGLNRRGKPVTYDWHGMAARIVQHEVDHLDGVLFIDKVDTSTLHWSLPEDEEAPASGKR